MKSILLIILMLLFTVLRVHGLVGCTDPLAINYNPDATEDSNNCVYESECGEGEAFFVFTFGYGQVEFTAYLTDIEMQDTLLSVVGFMAFQQAGTCLHPDSCYIWHLQHGEGVSYYQSPWILMLDSEMSTVDAFANGPGYEYRNYFSPSGNSCGTAGCMDESGMNYNPLADIDFGCVYCSDNELRFLRDTLFFNGNNTMLWNDNAPVQPITSQYISFYESRKCYEDGCYELVIAPQSSGNGASFNQQYLLDADGQLIWQGWRSHSDTVRIPIDLNPQETCQESEEIYGCTNPLAVNYNAQATRYDGTCDLFNGLCSFSFEFVPDSTAENTVHIVTSIQTPTYPHHAHWDFGDAPTIVSHFPSYTLTANEPVNVCVRFYVYDWQFDGVFPYCMDSFCLEFDPEAYGFSPGDQLHFITPDDDTGLNESLANVKVKCFPNPAKDYFQVSVIGHSKNLNRAVLTDLHGRHVLSRSIPSGVGETRFEMDASQLAPGMYILSVFSKTGKINQRVVVE